MYKVFEEIHALLGNDLEPMVRSLLTQALKAEGEAVKRYIDSYLGLAPEEQELIRQGKYIAAIKAVRNRTSWGLIEAKKAVDAFSDGYQYLKSNDEIITGDEWYDGSKWYPVLFDSVGKLRGHTDFYSIRRKR